MAKKRAKEARHPTRRVKRIIEQARLEARVIVAEARAQSADDSTAALSAARREAEQLRVDAVEAARLTVEAAHVEAERILDQARQQADAESRATRAEAELGAERLRASAAAAAEQMRRESIQAKEQARLDLEAERARWRNEALIEAARVREDARTEAEGYRKQLEAEREAILAEARAQAGTLTDDAVRPLATQEPGPREPARRVRAGSTIADSEIATWLDEAAIGMVEAPPTADAGEPRELAEPGETLGWLDLFPDPAARAPGASAPPATPARTPDAPGAPRAPEAATESEAAGGERRGRRWFRSSKH